MIELTWSAALDAASKPDAGDFAVTAGGSAASLASGTPVSITGRVLTLTLASAVSYGEKVIRVTYTKGANPIRDVPGNEAASPVTWTVDNKTPLTAPSFTDGNAVTFTVMENAAAGTAVGTLAVENRGDMPAFSLSSAGTDHEPFAIDAEGRITVATGGRAGLRDEAELLDHRERNRRQGRRREQATRWHGNRRRHDRGDDLGHGYRSAGRAPTPTLSRWQQDQGRRSARRRHSPCLESAVQRVAGHRLSRLLVADRRLLRHGRANGCRSPGGPAELCHYRADQRGELRRLAQGAKRRGNEPVYTGKQPGVEPSLSRRGCRNVYRDAHRRNRFPCEPGAAAPAGVGAGGGQLARRVGCAGQHRQLPERLRHRVDGFHLVHRCVARAGDGGCAQPHRHRADRRTGLPAAGLDVLQD